MDEALGAGQHLHTNDEFGRKEPAEGGGASARQSRSSPKQKLVALLPSSQRDSNLLKDPKSVRASSERAKGLGRRRQGGHQALRVPREPLRPLTFMCCMRNESLLNRASLSAASSPSKPAAASSVAMATAEALPGVGAIATVLCRGFQASFGLGEKASHTE